jgi:hypothetical protein
MRQPRGEENQLGRLVACIVGAVTKVQARTAHRPLAAIDGLAHGIVLGARRMRPGADACSGSMG